MIISKDLFIFGEQIFATIIPEGGSTLSVQEQLQQQTQQQQIEIIDTTASATTGTTEQVLKPLMSALTGTAKITATKKTAALKTRTMNKQETVNVDVFTPKKVYALPDNLQSKNTITENCKFSRKSDGRQHWKLQQQKQGKTPTIINNQIHNFKLIEKNAEELGLDTEQDSLMKKKVQTKIVAIVSPQTATASIQGHHQHHQHQQQQKQQHLQQTRQSECQLQLQLDDQPTTSTQSSSISPSSTSSQSSVSSHTSKKTIPNSVKLSTTLENMAKTILADTNRTDHNRADTEFSFALEQHPTLQLTFQNINVSHNEHKILSDVSGLVSPGEVLAVMGPSGSGKTTLLDCLSGQRRVDSGQIFLNREPLSKKWRRKIGYVLQEEIFFPQLTLRDTIMYTALLRLPESMVEAEKIRLVDHILETLELSFCQQTKIGDYLNRGLSGGEKKRANIACELLTNPLLMLLDEPTSGLDSHSAISLMTVLKRYALQEQKTIVITVHQPSSQMFHMFDKLLLLHNGRTAYFGEVNNIYTHFENIGVAIKPHYNPADFVLEQLKSYPEIREKLFVAAKNSQSHYFNRVGGTHGQLQLQNRRLNNCHVEHKEKAHNAILINNIISNYYNDIHSNLHHKHTDAVLKVGEEDAIQHLVCCSSDSQSNFSCSSSNNCHSYGNCDSGADWLDYPTRFHTQFYVLSSRNFKEAKPRMLSKLNWFQTIGLAFMAGAIWFQIPRGEEFLHDLQGWMFFSQTYWMLFALFGALNSFPSEREVISKERRSGAYRLSAYYLAKMVGELPLVITLPTIYLMISYPMLGCTGLKLFFLMLIFLLLNTIVAQSVGFFIGACCNDMNVSITLSALYTLATQLFGGYLSSRIPEGLSWIRYTSMIHYAYQNMQILEFSEGPEIRCGIPSSYEICKNNSTLFIPYEEILKAQNSNPLWLNTFILVMFLLVFRSLGYAVLRYVRCPKT